MDNYFSIKMQKQFSGERIAFSTNGAAGAIGLHMKKKNFYASFTLHTKSNFKFTIDLKENLKLQIFEEDIGESTGDFGLHKDFLETTLHQN